MNYSETLLREIESLNGTLYVKEEPEWEFHDNINFDKPQSLSNSIQVSEKGSPSIAEQQPSCTDELEIMEIKEEPSTKRRKIQNDKIHNSETAFQNGKSDSTQSPCIINIQSSIVREKLSQQSHNGTVDTPAPTPPHIPAPVPDSTSQSSITNSTVASTAYEILVDIQRTLKDLKAEVAENGKKIDQLQKSFPQPWKWKCPENDFNFPISSEEQLSEFEKELENDENAHKLFAHLTSRMYDSWKQMVLFCLKEMFSRNVAMLYNLNGVKGSKKKFRDLNICRLLVGSVQSKYKDAAEPDILRRISSTLALSVGWYGARNDPIKRNPK